MDRNLFALSFGFAGVILLTQHAQAGAQCAARAEIITMLENKYGESRQSIGLAGPDQVFELYAAPDSGTWTLLVTTAEGASCLVASGQHYQYLARETQVQGSRVSHPSP